MISGIKYFDVDFKDTPDWREWGELELPLVDMELKGIFQSFFSGGFAKACVLKVLRSSFGIRIKSLIVIHLS